MAFLFDQHGMLMGGKQRVLAHVRRVAKPGYSCTILPDPTMPAAPGYSNDPPVPGAVRVQRIDPECVPLLGTHALCPVETLFRLNLATTLFFCTEEGWSRQIRRIQSGSDRGDAANAG
ncbi:MAG: hypothetical protein Q8O14_02165 [bacterium]|nr:hypothetical protein [bacterium]